MARGRDYVEGFVRANTARTVFLSYGAESSAREEGAIIWICGGSLGGFERAVAR